MDTNAMINLNGRPLRFGAGHEWMRFAGERMNTNGCAAISNEGRGRILFGPLARNDRKILEETKTNASAVGAEYYSDRTPHGCMGCATIVFVSRKGAKGKDYTCRLQLSL